MQKIIALCLVCCSMFGLAIAQKREEKTLKTATGAIYGTLTIPAQTGILPVVLIIAGSGPTDRNGNSPQMQNNALRMIADSLAKHGIASLRYDKRGIAASKAAQPDESRIRFDNYIDDAVAWVNFLREDKRFGQYYIFGHSEGSLIGMMAAKRITINGFISAAGAGVPADVILLAQLRAAPQLSSGIVDTMALLLRELKERGKIEAVPAGIYQAFLRPTVQAYFASWMKYNPAQEIAGLRNTPTLIVQGTTDLQVDTAQARKLADARPGARLVLIPQMNHIFKLAEPGDIAGNSATYYEAEEPVMSELVYAVVSFIKGAKK